MCKALIKEAIKILKFKDVVTIEKKKKMKRKNRLGQGVDLFWFLIGSPTWLGLN